MGRRVDILLPALQPRGAPRSSPLDLSAPLAWTVADVLTPAECDALVARIEAAGPEPAPITTAGGFRMAPDIRNNTRVTFDDPALAAELYARVRHSLPPRLFGCSPIGANERFRCYRYRPGQFFAPHLDGAFRRSATEASELTFMVYLNDACIGGATRFPDFSLDVTPRTGTALLFQHRIPHEGAPVTAGVKYALRTDVMYGI